MKIIHIVSEVSPFSGYSSLAESVGNLAAEQSRQGHCVSVFSPFYTHINAELYTIKSTGLKTWVDAGFAVYEYELFTTEYNGVRYVFFKNDDLFGRSGLYGTGAFDYEDNDIRFGTFCQASMNYIKYHNIPADVLHAHNWQTALIPVYKKLYHGDLRCGTVLTVHSAESMGVFNKYSMETLNLPWDIYNIDFIEFYDKISFLKGGLVACDICTTISPAFADELISEEGFHGSFFKANVSKIKGILNGINYERWNPEKDELLPANYFVSDVSGKDKCKRDFCRELDLSYDMPLVCFITKLIPARGVELVLEAAKEFSGMGANLVIMGHSGTEYNRSLEETKNTPNVRVILGDYGQTSHRAYGAADIVLVPSLYEPCGIGQMIGMRYGAIPVVRDTGGLHDGVQEALKNNVGFVFDEFSVQAMMDAVQKAIALCCSDKRNEAVKKLMSFDNSWMGAAKQYTELYKTLSAEDKL